MYKFGIIGCGMISSTHTAALNEMDNAKLYGVFDTNSANCEKFAKENNAYAYKSLEEMLSDENIDIVCICLPSGLHAEYCIKALNCGKHVICEKPMALTSEDCEKIIDAEKKSGKMCAIISQLRFSDMWRKVKDAIKDGKLGKITQFGLHMKYSRTPDYYSSSPWRGTWKMDGGGALMNQGVHGVDLLLSFLGMPKTVFAYCKTLRHDIEVEDTAVAVLEYEDGPIGVIEATTSITPGYPRVFEICGTKGSIILQENTIKSWDIEGESFVDDTSLSSISYNDPSNTAHDGHKKEFEDFIEAIESGKKPLVNTLEGKKSVDLIRAIYKSSETGEKIYL